MTIKEALTEEALTAEPIALPRSTPEAQGVPSAAVLAFVDDAERRALGLHSLMLMRRGQIIAEGGWDPYRRAAPHVLYSRPLMERVPFSVPRGPAHAVLTFQELRGDCGRPSSG